MINQVQEAQDAKWKKVHEEMVNKNKQGGNNSSEEDSSSSEMPLIKYESNSELPS